MILVNDAKYIHLLPIFCTFQSSSYCKYNPFLNSFQSYLFRYGCWLSYFSANNQYTIQFESVYVVLNMFKSILKWFVFIAQWNGLHRFAPTRVEFLFQVLLEIRMLFRVDTLYSRVSLRISWSCEGETQIWQHMFFNEPQVART